MLQCINNNFKLDINDKVAPLGWRKWFRWRVLQKHQQVVEMIHSEFDDPKPEENII